MFPAANPLSDRELADLHRFLSGLPSGIGGIDALDGLFAALVSAPELVMPSAYLPVVLGQDKEPPFKSAREAERFLGLIMRHWNGVAEALLEGDYQPLFLLKDNRPIGEWWADGFLTGTDLGPKDGGWDRLARDPRKGKFLWPIHALADENDPDLTRGQPAITDQNREQIYDTVAPSVAAIYRHFEADRRRPPSGPSGPPTDEAQDDHWEIGLVPVAATIADTPDARIVAVLIVSGGGEIIRLTPEFSPPADPAALAKLVAREVDAAVEAHGKPPSIWVADQPTQTALRRSSRLKGTVLAIRLSRPALDVVAADFAEQFGSASLGKSAAHANTWTGWGLPPELVGRLFQAAATLFRVAPWRRWNDSTPLMVHWPDPGELPWAVTVMGAAGIETGIVCFLDARDAGIFANDQGRGKPLEALKGTMVSLLYNPRDQLPAAMRKEVLRQGWEVAAPEAYPMAMVFNAPTGGLAEPTATRLAVLLEALARLGIRRRTARWTDRETGLVIALPPANVGLAR
jgi:uncharacterized protein